MKIRRDILWIAAALLFSCSCRLSFAQAANAGDIENHWARTDIETVVSLGIAGGYPDGFFKPEQMVTRAEFVKMLVTACWVEPVKENEQPAFVDVGQEYWAYTCVEAADAIGILAEKNSGRLFEPERIITRAEVAAMAGRLMANESLLDFPSAKDDRQNNWVATMKKEGIICGYPDRSLGEESGLTRAEACVIVLRIKNKLLTEQTERERRWIASYQSNDGYMPLDGSRREIIPYFGNLAEMAQLGQPVFNSGVKKYLEWNLSNLNYPDLFGLNGTIYDYRLEDGVLQSVYSYDSADSYAATLLSLVAGYYRSTGDLTFVRAHYGDLAAVAEVIVTLQDDDGLIWAKPDQQSKYLMDNCECYRGLKDWSFLLEEMGFEERSRLYDSKAGFIKDGILNRFWDQDRACFAWALDQAGGKFLPQPGQAYPGFFAQIYPATYGVIAPASEKAVLAYQKLNEELPGWANLELGDSFPWVILGYAAVIMEDLSNADRFLENCRNTYILNGRDYPWSTFEAAFYIRAGDALQKKITAGVD